MKTFTSSPVISLIGRRLALGALTLWLVSIVVFASLQFLPGDFPQAILGQEATPEAVEAFRNELGLNDPAYERYLKWIGSLATGDLGTSFVGRTNGASQSVAALIRPRLANTMVLAACVAIISVPLALALGVLCARWRNTMFDRGVNAISLLSTALPEFFIAYCLMLILGSLWPLFPTVVDVRPDTSLLNRLYAMTLPIATLTLVVIAHLMRMTRASILNVLAAPYIEMAGIKGVRPFRIIVRHALPNAAGPIATVTAFTLAYLIVGVVVVEVVFVYPGIGQLMVDAVTTRDIPVVQACSLIFAATYITLNLIADIISIISNPKMMHPR